MAHHVTFGALTHILLGAGSGYMPNLVAFEAEFFLAGKGVVVVLATEDAAEACILLGTVPGHMAKFLTVATLKCRIFIFKVPGF